MTKNHILLVEDEQDVANIMITHLKREGHEVTWVPDGDEAVRIVDHRKFQLAILDWMLPGLSGIDLCKKFRGKFPILMVTARAEVADVVLGLELGADDYITKPFEIQIFNARVRALLRRGENATALENSKVFQIGALKLDEERHEVNCAGSVVDLTPSEFKLLAALMKNQGKVLSRDKLIDLIQGDGVTVTDRVIDTHVFGLRKKLGECGDFVETIRGIGYRISSA